MVKRIQTLAQFYDLMWNTVPVRRKAVDSLLKGKSVHEGLLQDLQSAHDLLVALPTEHGTSKLMLKEGTYIRTELTYEIEELQKDIICLEHPEETLYEHLESKNSRFFSEVEDGLRFLSNQKYNNFITDRDGTVNNYCGRYKSSVQSIYNSLFLVNFAQDSTLNSVILTSAPLENFGLLDLSVDPPHTFIYGGSKGREYVDRNGRKGSYPIVKVQQEKLDTLNNALSKLLKSEQYEQFALVGSGLQFKFGQTTVARQDIYKTIQETESELFYERVSGLVQDVDPEGTFFRIEDTGKDIEIILTIERDDTPKGVSDFNKGDGVYFLYSDLHLDLNRGPNLVCGDTLSDVAMVNASVEATKDTLTIFVTEDDELKDEVQRVCANSFFVSSPDILITILYRLSKRMR